MSAPMTLIDEHAAHAGPLQRTCPTCHALEGFSCTIATPPQQGDVRDLRTVRQQVLEFHTARLGEEATDAH